VRPNFAVGPAGLLARANPVPVILDADMESDVDDEIREIQNLVGKGAQDSAQLLG